MNWRLLALLVAALPLTACGDDDTNGGGATTDTGTSDAGEDTTTPDTGDDTTDPGDTSSDGSGTADAGTDTDEPDTDGPGLDEEVFFECESDDDCGPDSYGVAQICANRVCVVPPENEATLAFRTQNEDLSYTITPYPDEPINLDCFAEGTNFFEPAGENKPITLDGFVDRFGSGPPTFGLCVQVFDEQLLLAWQVNSECNGLADGDDDAYVGCFQLDACRCASYFNEGNDEVEFMVEGASEAMTQALGEDYEIDSLDRCFSFIGHCNGITDATEKAACEARVATNAYAPADNDGVLLAYTTSAESEADADRGAFSIPNIPTNWRFAYKVSGRESRWIDAWEYGLFTRGDLAEDDDTLRIDSNAVAAGTWSTIPPAVGLPGGIDDVNGAVAGTLRDCGTDSRKPYEIVHGTVGISFNAASILAYFNGNPNSRLPFSGRADTNIDGLYAAIDLPPGPNRVAPIILDAEGNLVRAGGRNVFQTPKSIIIATFEGIYRQE